MVTELLIRSLSSSFFPHRDIERHLVYDSINGDTIQPHQILEIL